jgi:hypothetical protein
MHGGEGLTPAPPDARKIARSTTSRRFALPLGLAIWIGLFVAVPVFFEGTGGPDFGYVGSRPFWLSLAASLILWPAAGYVWATWEWSRRETRFRATDG